MEWSPLTLLRRSMTFRMIYTAFWIAFAALCAIYVSPANAQSNFDGSEAQAALDAAIAGVPPRKPKSPRAGQMTIAKPVFSNGAAIVHKGKCRGVVVILLDVCKTPSPTGPIPIPYPNIASASDTQKGGAKVKIDGMPALTNKFTFKRPPSKQPPAQPSKIIGAQYDWRDVKFPAPNAAILQPNFPPPPLPTPSSAQTNNTNTQTFNAGFALPYSQAASTQTSGPTDGQMTEVAPPPLVLTGQ